MCLSQTKETKKNSKWKNFQNFCCLLKYSAAAAAAKRCALLSVEKFHFREKSFSHAAASVCALKSFSNFSLSFLAKEAWKVFNSFQAVSRSTNNNNSLVKMFIEHSRLSSFLFLEFTVHKRLGGRRKCKALKKIMWMGKEFFIWEFASSLSISPFTACQLFENLWGAKKTFFIMKFLCLFYTVQTSTKLEGVLRSELSIFKLLNCVRNNQQFAFSSFGWRGQQKVSSQNYFRVDLVEVFNKLKNLLEFNNKKKSLNCIPWDFNLREKSRKVITLFHGDSPWWLSRCSHKKILMGTRWTFLRKTHFYQEIDANCVIFHQC